VERLEYAGPQKHCHVIGDEMYKAWRTWNAHELRGGRQFPNQVSSFIQWMMETLSGDQARRRINDFPRQLWLPFEDHDKPWRVEDDPAGGEPE
jgi:hypothetical protein